ncbi:MAG: transporter substrate-binding domain-containing protein [Phreatobacter sp.]
MTSCDTAGTGRPSWRDGLVFACLEEPPFCGRNAAGEVTGCDIAVARHVLAAAGAGPVDFVMTAFAELLPGLADGRWAMTTGLFVTPERARRAAFSRPIWALPDGLLVASGNPKGLTGYAAIASAPAARIGVIEGQVQHQAALAAGIPLHRVIIHATQSEAAEAVRHGEIDAYASFAMAHRGYLAKAGGQGLQVVEVDGPAQAGAFTFALANDGLAEAVDAALAGFLGSPAHRALMLAHGFGGRDVDRIAPGG